MSYVDGFHLRERDIISIVERVDGERVYKNFPARYVMYYKDKHGEHKSIWNEPLKQVSCRTQKEFYKEKKMRQGVLYESDITPMARCLEDNYLHSVSPKLNVCFFDIETDFDEVRGFAPPSDPFHKVTAIGLHLNWLNKTICLTIKPKTLSKDEAQAICDKFDNVILFDTEADMLLAFLDLIDDTDILTGWNSEGFDIPYMVNRVALVLGKDYTRKFCLWDQYPRKREYEKFGKAAETYDTVGRVHLDYMALFMKYTYHVLHSYSLDAVCELELGETKVEYEGTLDSLYNNDYYKFIEYNIQDVNLLVKLDEKLQYIDLTNLIAHANTVLLQTTLGAVAQTEQAIVNEAHRLGLIVPDKKSHADSLPAAGAYVAVPVTGLHYDIGSIDLNSLYPSILRSCNMSTETIVAQIRHTETQKMLQPFLDDGKPAPIPRAWEGKFATPEYELVMAKDKNVMMVIDFHNGDTFEATGAELYQLIFDSGYNWTFSANATVFSADTIGIIPGLLASWYAERKVMQRKAKMWKTGAKRLLDGIEIPDRLK
jgi:DNA polymerase elongation subunit (family B)